jgi:hypothetical protein
LQLFDVAFDTKVFVDMPIVGRVVLVQVPGLKDGVEVNSRDAQLPQVRQFLSDALDVAAVTP